jgi:hypothetical protein
MSEEAPLGLYSGLALRHIRWWPRCTLLGGQVRLEKGERLADFSKF